MSPNLSGVVHVHPLYVAVAHKSKMEVSPSVAQIGARLPLEDATLGDIVCQISRSAKQISGSWSTNSPTYGCHKTYTFTLDVKNFYVNMNEITIEPYTFTYIIT